MLGGALAETSLTNLRNGCEFLANTVRDFLPAARICPEETVQFLQSQLGADREAGCVAALGLLAALARSDGQYHRSGLPGIPFAIWAVPPCMLLRISCRAHDDREAAPGCGGCAVSVQRPQDPGELIWERKALPGWCCCCQNRQGWGAQGSALGSDHMVVMASAGRAVRPLCCAWKVHSLVLRPGPRLRSQGSSSSLVVSAHAQRAAPTSRWLPFAF